MKRLLAFGIAGLVLIGPMAKASVTWMDLSAEIIYQDPTTACSEPASPGNDMYLVLDVEGGQVTAATLKYGPVSLPTYVTALSPAEVAGIQVVQDTSGVYWLKSFTLSPRLITVLTYELGSYSCGNLSRIAQVAGAPLTLVFNPDPTELLYENRSQQVSFNGTTESGQPFSETMTLLQKAYEPLPPVKR